MGRADGACVVDASVRTKTGFGFCPARAIRVAASRATAESRAMALARARASVTTAGTRGLVSGGRRAVRVADAARVMPSRVRFSASWSFASVERGVALGAFRGAPEPKTEEEEGSVLDFPEEYVRAVPSRRPDIFPDLKEPKTPMPRPMPGDPEMPDEEEEEKERKENPGEPGEKPDDEEDEEEKKKKEKKKKKEGEEEEEKEK